MKLRFLQLFCLIAMSCLSISCMSSGSLFQHGITTMSINKMSRESLFVEGLSGRKSDALIVLLEKNMVNTAQGKIIVNSKNIQVAFLFPNDFVECSSWLSDENSKKRAFLVRIGNKGFNATKESPLRIEQIGFEVDLDIYLWKLPGWYFKR